MKLMITDIAEFELKEAIAYYNNECPGLGYEFAYEIQKVFERIAENPEAWTPLSPRSRRCMARHFPYAVVYQLRKDEILIVAIMHMHRNPKILKDRLY